MQNYTRNRLQKVQEQLKEKEALFINLPEEVSYLTGFTGDDSCLVVFNQKTFFITDGRYVEQYKLESRIDAGLLEIKPDRKLTQILADLIKNNHIEILFFYKKEISCDFIDNLKTALGPADLKIENSLILKELRICKDEYEIEIIRQNLLITELGFHMIMPLIEKGRTEAEIAADLEYYLKKKGAKKTSFDTIVASGFRSALPHGTAGDKMINDNEIVLFDFGIVKDGYCSDFTRCYYFGTIIDPKISEIHKVVLEALKKAESLIAPGIPAKEIHEAASGVIREAGYGEYFTHSTGHGVGLQIHELPGSRRARKGSSKKAWYLRLNRVFICPAPAASGSRTWSL